MRGPHVVNRMGGTSSEQRKKDDQAYLIWLIVLQSNNLEMRKILASIKRILRRDKRPRGLLPEKLDARPRASGPMPRWVMRG